MAKVSWVDKITNIEVYNKVRKAPCTIWKHIKTRRDKFIGHSLRHPELLNEVIYNDSLGNNRKGRPSMKFESQIIDDIGFGNIAEMYKLAQDTSK